MKKTTVKISKPIYLRMSILDINKTLMHEFWYDYIQPKYQDSKTMLMGYWQLCYSYYSYPAFLFVTEDFYKDIANNAEKWLDTSNYDKGDKSPLPISKNKKVIGIFKDQLGRKIIMEFVGLRVKP